MRRAARRAAALGRAFTTGKVEALTPFLSDEGTVEVVTVCSVCDPPDERETKKLARGALVKHIARAADHVFVEEVCVRRGPDGAPKLSRLVLIDGA